MKLKFGLFMFILLFGWPKIIIWVLSDEFFEFLFFTVDLMRDGERFKVCHLCVCVCVVFTGNWILFLRSLNRRFNF